jgi:hypothetical protein
MSQVVKRRRQSLIIDCDGDRQPIETHRTQSMTVESQLSWGIDPKVSLAWTVEPAFWRRGFKLMVFRSTTGFCPDENPADLNSHGALITEKRHDGTSDERVAEGTYFYTFVLCKRHWHGLTRSTDILRFSLNIPSAKVAIGRIQDQRALRELAQAEILGPMQFHTEIYETKARRKAARRTLREASHRPESTQTAPKNKVIEDAKSTVDAIIEAFLAKGQKLEEVQKDPRFGQLSESDRRKLFRRIKEVFDPAEILARNQQS